MQRDAQELLLAGDELSASLKGVRQLRLPNGQWVSVYDSYIVQDRAVLLTVSSTALATLTIPLGEVITVTT